MLTQFNSIIELMEAFPDANVRTDVMAGTVRRNHGVSMGCGHLKPEASSASFLGKRFALCPLSVP